MTNERRGNIALPVHIASFAAGYLVAHITEHEYPRAAPIPLDAVEFAASLNAHFTWQLDVVPHQTRQVFELLRTCNQEEKAIKTSYTSKRESVFFLVMNNNNTMCSSVRTICTQTPERKSPNIDSKSASIKG